ncbi:DUF4389 domain-containing protein [Qaidamihabitans albus]|uniref:DUF4389 domain-containing protein n=1 Tax=Qaidamihabitans albus TaxID=2795733 RepID=UPI0018F1982C|nr:DUF4389 domain-containing protein [Qaidamihabitans albus]
MTTAKRYPVRVEAELDPGLSRWRWLVKWLLAFPHYVLLALLWTAFGVLSVVAFFAILFTGRYPRAIFDFNVGVLRWTWRVQYYAYAALGTDRYPPFTLADVPDYPARLQVDYPTRLSRGLVLVKWWLLAIPHYLVVGLFAGGGLWLAWRPAEDGFTWGASGLIGILLLIAGVLLLVTGQYPRPVFDFVLGMDRWIIRVAAYAGLMTDEYPPFRLDMGGRDPAGPVEDRPAAPAPMVPAEPHAHHWTPGRVASVVVGAVLAFASMGLLTGGAALLWADRVERGADGYLSLESTIDTGGYALTTERVALTEQSVRWLPGTVGDVRVRVVGTDPLDPVFVGIAPADEAARYLAGVEHATIRDAADGSLTFHSGGPPETAPDAAGIWAARSSGPGTQTVSWPAGAGDWTVVVMNADAAPGVSVRTEAGATVPALPWIGVAVLASGALFLAAGAALLGVAAHRASRPPERAAVPG